MPIFADPERRLSTTMKEPEPTRLATMNRNLSEESIRTEFCDGPLPDTPPRDTSRKQARESLSLNILETRTSNRAELIERIKRGESPTWVPNQALAEEFNKNLNDRTTNPHSNVGAPIEVSSLLPAAELRGITQDSTQTSRQASRLRLSPPLEIQRPRSALHAGDFRKDADNAGSITCSPTGPGYAHNDPLNGPLGSSPTSPWYMPSSSFEGFHARERTLDNAERTLSRSRAPSLSSYSSSYVLKAPTTPLVQQSNNTDLDFSPRDCSISPSKSNRRHTMPPQALQALQFSSGGYSSMPRDAEHPPLRRDTTFPLQTHHSRRSLTSNWSLQASTSQTAGYLRPRRLSHSSETSPLQHASMVGSYEESILRGWMSTAPSKPLDFTAQIGVLGKGNCKPKCPAHVTVPFPAVFYKWSGGGVVKGIANDEPSPYVGHIDLQQLLIPSKPNARERKRSITQEFDGEYDSTNPTGTHGTERIVSSISIRKRKKHRQPSPDQTPPPGGSYRIPQQGQLQIIIKNPNKTAVKLFLVPYDLEGMEGGTKTFIRQRCYSTEPVMSSSLVSRSPHDMDLSPSAGHGSQTKPSLRYLIHLNICSPSKGRFYLYQHIRVVFANRVPDNKEQLQNEIQLPQPRYSAYKAHRDSISGSGSVAGARLTAEKAYRRRSSGFNLETIDGHYSQPYGIGRSFSSTSGTVAPPVPAIPFNLTKSKRRLTAENLELDETAMDLDTSRPTTSSDMQSPLSDMTNRFYNGVANSFRSTSSQSSDSYGKLNKGDDGYGGVFGRPATPQLGDGLLARKLKSLGVSREGRHDDEL